MKKNENQNNEWEVKDRLYTLVDRKPLSLRLSSRHSMKSPLLYFDEVKSEQRELRYATNHNSPFVDEQKGSATLGQIIFRSGKLLVAKEQQNLQKLLSLYHPKRNILYKELKPQKQAAIDIDYLEMEIDALNIARDLEVDHGEAILRVEVGASVSKMSSKEIKRDILIFARRNPTLFLELVNDENVQLRDFAIKASENNIIKLSQDQRTFTWGSNDKKLMTVPFEENPYSAFAAWLKTDEGVEVYKSIDKKLK